MQLEVGQVYKLRDLSRDLAVVVLEVRDEDHPRGLGKGYGVSACAWPIQPYTMAFSLSNLHPMDVYILCGAQEHHGDKVWELIQGVHFADAGDGHWRFYGPGEETRA